MYNFPVQIDGHFRKNIDSINYIYKLRLLVHQLCKQSWESHVQNGQLSFIQGTYSICELRPTSGIIIVKNQEDGGKKYCKWEPLYSRLACCVRISSARRSGTNEDYYFIVGSKYLSRNQAEIYHHHHDSQHHSTILRIGRQSPSVCHQAIFLWRIMGP